MISSPKCYCRLVFFFLTMILSAFLGEKASAQSKFAGQVKEDKTELPVRGVQVENMNSHLKATTIADGTFIISAKVGDTLKFSASFFRSDTVFIIDKKFLQVTLLPVAKMLNEVKITSTDVKTGGLKYTAPTPFGGQTLRYQVDDTGHPIGGVKLMLYTNKSREKREAKEAKFNADEDTKAKIAKTFSEANLHNYLPITGQELKNFIVLYTPDVKTYSSAKFNLLQYLEDSYKQFKKLPAERRQSANLAVLK